MKIRAHAPVFTRLQSQETSGGWWLVLVYCERKLLLAGWQLVLIQCEKIILLVSWRSSHQNRVKLFFFGKDENHKEIGDPRADLRPHVRARFAGLLTGSSAMQVVQITCSSTLLHFDEHDLSYCLPCQNRFYSPSIFQANIGFQCCK